MDHESLGPHETVREAKNLLLRDYEDAVVSEDRVLRQTIAAEITEAFHDELEAWGRGMARHAEHASTHGNVNAQLFVMRKCGRTTRRLLERIYSENLVDTITLQAFLDDVLLGRMEEVPSTVRKTLDLENVTHNVRRKIGPEGETLWNFNKARVAQTVGNVVYLEKPDSN